MPKVYSKNIPFDRALRLFRRKVDSSGILQEVRKREYYEKPAQKKQRKLNQIKRKRKKLTIPRKKREEKEKEFNQLANQMNHQVRKQIQTLILIKILTKDQEEDFEL